MNRSSLGWIVALILALLIPLGAMLAHAGEPVANSLAPPITDSAHVMTDAATLGQKIPPLASFGVMQCGEIVAIWVVLQDKSVLRTDANHHPETVAELNGFLKWLSTAQEDLYEIPCPAKHKAD